MKVNILVMKNMMHDHLPCTEMELFRDMCKELDAARDIAKSVRDFFYEGQLSYEIKDWPDLEDMKQALKKYDEVCNAKG